MLKTVDPSLAMSPADQEQSIRESAVTVVGKESVGKSQLIASLTGTFPSVENLRGSTISVQRYRGDDLTLIDTPGIFRQSDTETTRLAMEALGDSATYCLS